MQSKRNTTKVKNGSYQVQIPSDGVLRAYKNSNHRRVQGILKTIKPYLNQVKITNLGKI